MAEKRLRDYGKIIRLNAWALMPRIFRNSPSMTAFAPDDAIPREISQNATQTTLKLIDTSRLSIWNS